MSITITVSNQKGGVGKTTTSAAIASGIFLRGKKVLGIDLDPQGNLGFCLGSGMDNRYTVLDVLKGTVPVQEALFKSDYGDLLVSDITLSSSGLESIPARREYILKNAIAPIGRTGSAEGDDRDRPQYLQSRAECAWHSAHPFQCPHAFIP